MGLILETVDAGEKKNKEPVVVNRSPQCSFSRVCDSVCFLPLGGSRQIRRKRMGAGEEHGI